MENAEVEDSDDDIPLFPRLPDPDDEPLFPGPLFPGPIVPLDPAPPLPPDLVADSDDDVFPLDSDDEPLFPGPPLNPAPPVPPPVVMMVPLINHHYPLTIVDFASETAPPFHVPFYLPALGSNDKDEAMPTLIPDDDDENEYDHIDNRAIDVSAFQTTIRDPLHQVDHGLFGIFAFDICLRTFPLLSTPRSTPQHRC